MEEHASRRSNVEALKDLWVQQRQRNHLFELLDVLLHATDRLKVDGLGWQQRVCVGKACQRGGKNPSMSVEMRSDKSKWHS